MSSTIFDVPITEEGYETADKHVMIHDLQANPPTSTQLIPFEDFKKAVNVNTFFVPFGQLLVFKAQGNTNLNTYQAGDKVIGIVEGVWIRGIYNSGNPSLLTSYDLIDQF